MTENLRRLTPESKELIDGLVSRRRESGPTEITEEEFEEGFKEVVDEQAPMIKEAVENLQSA